jgi:uncharacterized protein (DUF1330 family)
MRWKNHSPVRIFPGAGGAGWTRGIIIPQFLSVARAQEFYHSPEYRKARKLRVDAAYGELIVVGGFLPG